MKQTEFKDLVKIDWVSWEEIKRDLIKNGFTDKKENAKQKRD